jgi:solute carrier family 8 (sodium/calcium exchanger)
MDITSTIIPNLTDYTIRQCTTAASVCKDGLVLPRWEPVDNLTGGDMFIRATVYFLGLLYLFMGVNIVSDRFMSAIETITSEEKRIEITDKNGEKQVVMVSVWNETVSNLTLMALGSSAPEIMLSVIEVCGNNFEAGDLGPNTIVGSAAFNLFVIIGYCVMCVPEGEIRRIKHLDVFFVTASMSIFAYVWLYLIIAVISRGVVEWWEGLLTFIYFPLTVLVAYWVDTKYLVNNFLTKKILNVGFLLGTKKAEEQTTDANGQPNALLDAEAGIKKDDIQGSNANLDAEIKNFEDNRREYINVLKELRQKHPLASVDELQQLAYAEVINRGPKSRAYYRIQATRKLIGGNANVKKRLAEKESLINSKSMEAINTQEEVDPHLTQVLFDPAHYTCFENVGYMDVYVARQGGDLNKTVLVDYKTEDGSAEANKDYIPAEGTLTFFPGETRKKFSVKVLDDDVYEEDETFYAKLLNVRYKSDHDNQNAEATLKLSHPSVATIMVLDDDHHGIFLFAEESQEVVENAGAAFVKVMRTSGARGKVTIPYKTVDITAVGGRDYEIKEDYLVFNNNETE